MSYVQVTTPNPNIPCRPGWCLQYVREAFGLPARYASATEAWEKSTSQHRDRNFPPGVWHPVWYGLVNEPLGHVILRAPDGSVYSTSDLTNTPHHHPDLADLEAFYAYYGMTLTYRGWTEDVAGYPVIATTGLAAQGTITTPKELFTVTQYEDLVNRLEDIANTSNNIHAGVWKGGKAPGGKQFNYGILPIVAESQRRDNIAQAQISNLVSAIAALSKGEKFDEAKLLAGVQAAAEAGVKAGIAEGTVTVDVNVNGGAL